MHSAAFHIKEAYPGSYPAHQQQDEYNQKDHSKSATGVVSPFFAVRPCRQCTEEYENQNDDEYESHGYFLPCRTKRDRIPWARDPALRCR